MVHTGISLAGILAFLGVFQKEIDPVVFIKLLHDPDLVASFLLETCLADHSQPESMLGLLYLADRDRCVSGFG